MIIRVIVRLMEMAATVAEKVLSRVAVRVRSGMWYEGEAHSDEQCKGSDE